MTLRRIGYKGRLVAHGLRALASTTLNEQGFDAELIEVSLAYVDKITVRAAYNRAAISNDAESSRAGGVNIFQHRLRPTTQTYAF
ncbi:hypothetical protein [uncultured Shewanella sp.]|uniref:hypothetical protein n=1 Tax=uncultured Shewanella sp. TaxID=173975 RepID=UPI00262964F8|nr:hypothetical protein [uncultured Shewanella sp.]